MISTAFKTSILASLAAAATAAAATDYWAITPAPATDAMNASSISGYTSANGAPVGWAAEKGSDVVAVAGITEENAVYHVWQDELVHRSPAGNQGQGAFATPSSSSIVIEDGCVWNVTSKIGNNGVLTLSNLVLKAGATFFFRTNADASTDERQTLGGTIDMAEGSLLKLNSYVHNSSKTTYLVKQATLAATVAGKGRITALRGPAVISGTGNEATANSSKAPVQCVTGDLSGFTGDLEVYGEGTQKNVWLRLMGESSIPGDPAPDELAYVIVTNAAKLRVDHDWVSPTNRVWILGSSGTPEIYVDAGKTLTINGPVVGTVGLKKTGEGTLILNDRSRLSGTITVSAGKAPRIVYIAPDADGTGNGGSWSSPMMLTNYLVTANIKDGDIVRLKSGHYTARIQQVTFGNYLTVKISGGYAGTDGTTLDAENPVSEIDFANYPASGNYAPLQFTEKTGYAVTLERLRLTRAKNAPIYKRNSGTLTLTDCVVVSNGWRNYASSNSSGGRGLHAEQGSVTLDKCTFAYNGMYFGSGSVSTYGDDGYGVYLSATTARLTGCKFIGNGAKISDEAPVASVRGAGRGLALYATGSKVYAEECDFLCNRAALGSYTSSTSSEAEGGIVVLAGNCGGSWFTNCSWVANQNLRDTTYNGNTYYGGVLTVDMSSRNYAVSVDKCTFAYNITDSANAAAGIDVRNGTLNLRNSVFAGNYARTGNTLGVDLVVRTNGTANVAYCLFSSTNDTNVTVEEIGGERGELSMTGIVLGDARLATDLATAQSLVKTRTAKPYLVYDPARIDEVLAFDVHPRSKAGRWTAEGYVQDTRHSPAIDAGDPFAPFGDEPRPNGRRLNLGRYGGTAEASLTLTGGTVLLVQ